MKRHTNFIDRTGEKWITNEGYEVTIIEYFNWSNCAIQFENGLVIKNMAYNHIKNGQVKIRIIVQFME